MRRTKLPNVSSLHLPSFLLFTFFFVAYNRFTYILIGKALKGFDSYFGQNAFTAFVSTKVIKMLSAWQCDSDSLIIGRLKENISGGAFSNWPLLRPAGTNNCEGWPFFQNFELGDLYLSQSGLVGWLITLPSAVLQNSAWPGIAIMYCFAAGLSSLIAVWIIRLTHRNLHRIGTILMVLILLQPWLVVVAGSIYWLIGLKLLPAIAVVQIFKGKERWFGIAIPLTALCSFLVFSSGYEFLTVVIILPTAALTYFASIQKWPIRTYLFRAFGILVGQLIGLFLSLVTHFLILRKLLGNGEAAFLELRNVVVKRTGITQSAVENSYSASLKSSPSEVLSTYLDMPIIGAPLEIPILNFLTVGVLIVVCISTIPFLANLSEKYNSPQIQAVGLSWVVSLLGPLGWFTLARPHSYVHTHINYVLWFFPTIPLAVFILSGAIESWFSKVHTSQYVKLIFLSTLIILLLMFCYSQFSMR